MARSLTGTIDSYYVLAIDLSDGFRYSNMQFDAFGMGITNSTRSRCQSSRLAA